MERDKTQQREYEKLIASLRRQLKDGAAEREQLSANLDKQQKLFIALRESQKKKDAAAQEIVTRNRTLTEQEQVEEEAVKLELLEAVDEQKAYIAQLESENQRLMASKLWDDDHMFAELKQFRHRIARSMQMDALSDVGVLAPTSDKAESVGDG